MELFVHILLDSWYDDSPIIADKPWHVADSQLAAWLWSTRGYRLIEHTWCPPIGLLRQLVRRRVDWPPDQAYIYLYNLQVVETTHCQWRHAVLCVLWSSSIIDRQVSRSGKTLLLGNGLTAAGREPGNGSQVFTAFLLTVLWLISLTIALAWGSARVAGLDASTYICYQP